MSELNQRANRPDPHVDQRGPTGRIGKQDTSTVRGTGRQDDEADAADLRLAVELEQYLAESARRVAPAPHGHHGEEDEVPALAEVFYRVRDLVRKLGGKTIPRPTSEGPEQIGKYEVSLLLGSGGQAQTWLSFDPDLQRHVVIKLYHNLTCDADREAVLREGRALARVRSPYVAQCYGVEWLDDSEPYLLIEYIAGRPVDEVAGDRAMPAEEAIALIAQIGEGLAAVHACGLLHGDVTPANVLIGDDGVPRLVDFGLAESPGTGQAGRIQGTPQFMSPEQARGETDRVGVRSDVFGLGAVLYWLLTGRAPFEAGDLSTAWERARAGEVTPVRELAPETPAWIADLCMRCLAAHPQDRYGSVVELLQVIRQH